MTFDAFVERWTGRNLAYHEIAGTTGIVFAESCWNEACKAAAALAKETTAGCDADAIAEAILRLRSNADAQPAMKRLSDEEIRAIGKDAFGIDLIFDGRLTEFAKAIEDALLEKNK